MSREPWEGDDREQYRIGPPKKQVVSFDLGPLLEADAEAVRLAREAVALERERLQVQEARTAADRKRALVASTMYPSIARLTLVCVFGLTIACIGIFLLSFLPSSVGWSLIFFGAIIDVIAVLSFALLDDQKQRIKKNLTGE